MRRKHVIVRERLPLATVRLTSPETPAPSLRRDTESLGARLGAHGSVFDRSGEPARFARRRAARVAVIGNDGRTGRDCQNDEDNQNFDQRESARSQVFGE